MLRNISRMALLTSLLAASVTSAEARQNVCSMDNLAGEWALTVTGSVVVSGNVIPMVALVRLTITEYGNLSATQTSSSGGIISAGEVAKGSAMMNSDCTGTLTVNVYDSKGNLLRASHWETVLADNAAELRAICVSLMRGNTPVGPVITAAATKLFTRKSNEQ